MRMTMTTERPRPVFGGSRGLAKIVIVALLSAVVGCGAEQPLTATPDRSATAPGGICPDDATG